MIDLVRTCKKTVLLACLLVVFSSGIFGGFLVVSVAGATIRVPDDYPTIQEAINAASPGDTIIVAAGTYPEQVVINKTVSLVGEDRVTTVIEGNSTGYPGIVHITADNAVFSGFTVRNGFYGIRLHRADGAVVEDNIIAKPSFGGI